MARRGLWTGPGSCHQEVAELGSVALPSVWPRSPALGHCAEATLSFLLAKSSGPDPPCHRLLLK